MWSTWPYGYGCDPKIRNVWGVIPSASHVSKLWANFCIPHCMGSPSNNGYLVHRFKVGSIVAGSTDTPPPPPRPHLARKSGLKTFTLPGTYKLGVKELTHLLGAHYLANDPYILPHIQREFKIAPAFTKPIGRLTNGLVPDAVSCKYRKATEAFITPDALTDTHCQ